MRRKRSDSFFFFLAKQENGAITRKKSQIKGIIQMVKRIACLLGGKFADAGEKGETSGASL